MTVLVTGANGHLGAALVRELLSQGTRVRALIHTANDALKGLEVDEVAGSMTDEASLRSAVMGCTTVYHLASVISISGRNEPVLDSVNVVGAGLLAQVCREAGVARMVHFSSIHALSEHPRVDPIDESNAPAKGRGFLPYDRSKASGEAAVLAQVALGLDAVIVNPVGCMGPYDYAPSRMGLVLLDLYHRRLPSLVNGGYTWVDSRDVAKGAIAAAARGKTGERYILGNTWASIQQIGAWAEESTGKRAPRFVSPIWLAKVGVPFSMLWAALIRTEPKFTFASLHALSSNPKVSSEKARRELGFTTRPLKETVADCYDWFRAEGVISE